MVHIFYTIITKPIKYDFLKKSLLRLSPDLRKKYYSYVFWQDAHANLLGKLLLIKALEFHGKEPIDLLNLEYNDYGKPFLANTGLDFNISHSGNLVLCAIHENNELGIDTEIVKPIVIDDFKSIFDEVQWQKITNSKNPVSRFFEYWVIKESAIKADSRGLSIPLDEIDIDERRKIVSFEGKKWFYSLIDFNSNMKTCLATKDSHKPYEIFYVDFYDDLQIQK